MQHPVDSDLFMKEVLYEVRCLKSNEDMSLALAGQFFFFFLSNCHETIA